MNRASEPQKWVPFIVCLWLCLLIAGYLLLHTFYSFISLSNPPLLYFLPAMIYIIGGVLIAKSGFTRIRVHGYVAWILSGFSIILFLIGAIFIVIGMQQLLVR